jgi:uncharacterized membrane protein YphA (DoxX/SURF4 family)
MQTVAISKTSLIFLRTSIGIIFLWFGILKFFSGCSPAEELAINTINRLTFNIVPAPMNIILLALWECTVGILLILGYLRKYTLVLLFVHKVCTFTPMVFFPELSFKTLPYGFTLLGQYIMKNIIIFSAAWILWQEKA